MAELLDVVAADGLTRLGAKDRDAVHREGDWHLAFHLWVVRADGVLLQRRARDKESWPGRLDATAAGHLVAGESPADGLREVEEELGVRYRFEDLVGLGVHRVDDEPRRGFINREHQHVFGARDERALDAWTAFDRKEVDGLALVGHEAFAALAGAGVTVRGLEWDGRMVRDVTISVDDLVPAPYLAAIAPDLARLAA